MSSLCVHNLKPGVAIEIGPHIRIIYARDARGRDYFRIEAPANFKIKRVAPGTTFNGAARVCPRCASPVQAGRRCCGACGKDLGGVL